MKISMPVLLFGMIASMNHGMQVTKAEKHLFKIQKIYGLHRGSVEVRSYLNIPPAVIQKALTPDRDRRYDFTALEQCWYAMARSSQKFTYKKIHIVGELCRDSSVKTVVSHFDLPPMLIHQVLAPRGIKDCTTYDLTSLEKQYMTFL